MGPKSLLQQLARGPCNPGSRSLLWGGVGPLSLLESFEAEVPTVIDILFMYTYLFYVVKDITGTLFGPN